MSLTKLDIGKRNGIVGEITFGTIHVLISQTDLAGAGGGGAQISTS